MTIEKHDISGSTENTLVPVGEKVHINNQRSSIVFNIGTKKMRRLAEDNRGQICGNSAETDI